ncbi:MAG: ATP-binding protein [Propionibacteriaceae bacterium]|nr:putative DNA binding domain-containing protein [Micropruina sp.]
MTIVFGGDPIRLELEAIVMALEAGSPIDDSVERQFVDLKEEAGRRDGSGAIRPGQTQNEVAAGRLLEAAACMANTPGGGALLVGVSNSGELIGTNLDSEWLRSRIWELSGGHLTLDVAEVVVKGARLLVLRAPQAVEPIRVDGKIRWRVSAKCVEVDANTWHAKRMGVLNYDWSADESRVAIQDVRPAALTVARDLLRDSGEPHALELANESDTNLLRRLNVVTADGLLTNAGVLAFVGREQPCLDYIRRAGAGGDSLSRLRREGRSLLEELRDVSQAVDANTSTVHLPGGLVAGQHREIPRRAAREAIVNGVAHREWGIAEPTVVEHVGRLLRVTSPGGFFGGVTADNIITHPSRSRNKALAELLAALRVAEREGVGVDRMVTDMVSVGHSAPEIQEIQGPYVRVSLVGDDLDVAWINWLKSLQPAEEAEDLNSLLILRHLVQVGWVDERVSAPLIQDTQAVARGALAKLSRVRMRLSPVIRAVEGAPSTAPVPWRLSVNSRASLDVMDFQARNFRAWPSREAIAASYAAARGRISSTELGSLVDASPTNMGPTLKSLEDQGVLEPAWLSRRGKGFYYKYAGGVQ